MGQRAFLIAIVILLCVSAAFSATIPPNTITPLGPGYHLDIINGRLIDPCWFVSITGSTLPAVQSLDLGNPEAPQLHSDLVGADPGAVQEFKMYIGMLDPMQPGSQQFTFDVPASGPNTDGNFGFTASSTATSAVFNALLHLDVGDGSVIRWSVAAPPENLPGRTSFEIDFVVDPGTAPAGDPILTFSLDEVLDQQTTTLDFVAAPTPEPQSLSLLVIGMLGLAAWTKRQSMPEFLRGRSFR